MAAGEEEEEEEQRELERSMVMRDSAGEKRMRVKSVWSVRCQSVELSVDEREEVERVNLPEECKISMPR